jgi:hypothetical protein
MNKFFAETNNHEAIRKGLSLEFNAEGKLEWVVQINPSRAC